MPCRRIAIVGTGISGLVAARVLGTAHDIAVFEAEDRPGGHTHTHELVLGVREVAVDTGFIVYNERAYPNFIRLLAALGVATRPASMSFGVRCDRTGLEYGGETWRGLFAQPRNLVRPKFWRLLAGILRFGREADELRRPGDESEGLVPYLRRRGYPEEFIEHYARPIGAAIWSAPPGALDAFPARRFIRFFDHHGVIDPRHAPQWRTVVGGSKRYIEPLIAPFRDRIRLGDPVERVARVEGGVAVRTRGGHEERFDDVVIAAHSDQALAMLADPRPLEREILAAMPYQANDLLLHSDSSVMPRARRAWASWNYLIPAEPARTATVTYWMNLLQGIESPEPLLVSLNCADRIDPARVLRRLRYDHPCYTVATAAAQERRREIDGVDRIHYCGAYWGYGFHEDGVESALVVTRRLGLDLADVERQAGA